MELLYRKRAFELEAESSFSSGAAPSGLERERIENDSGGRVNRTGAIKKREQAVGKGLEVASYEAVDEGTETA